MNLLILTQKVDKDDDVLGFFHRWVEVLASRFDQVSVICLFKGAHSLPSNVKVYSLGKEEGLSRFGYVKRFFKYIWELRNEYDSVLVHMNPEYMVLGGFLWRIWGKRVSLWYNHKKGGLRLSFGRLFAHNIFYTSPEAYTARYKKGEQMPVGVDTSLRVTTKRRVEKSILLLGRISPVKRVHVMLDALSLLHEKGVTFSASIYGDPTDVDEVYYKKMREQGRELEKKGVVTFSRGVSYAETLDIYAQHELFINATPSGSFDKTIFEAIQGGALPVICNTGIDGFPSELLFKEDNASDLSMVLEKLLKMDAKEKEKLHRTLSGILGGHSLDTLAHLLVEKL